jgi:4-hydroxythreonine-4-phosphate dehydrogenase
MKPVIALTTGEPAGVGPELCVQLAARREWPMRLVLLGDPDLLLARARRLGLHLGLRDYAADSPERAPLPGVLEVAQHPLTVPSVPGRVDPANSPYVLALLDRAIAGCLSGEFAAMVTAPVHKAVINDAGIAFTGHTEYLAEKTGTRRVVMLLLGGGMRVALATTHLALKDVPGALTREALEHTLRVVFAELRAKFGIREPRILVAGLNPHAGEGGHLGREEIEIIAPVVESLRAQGLNLIGPLPADTLFTPQVLARGDCVVAMYHDQGLPVLKHAGFGHGVNVTLGLPIIRTSVDHGTALDLAGTGKADPGSLRAAAETAIEIASRAAA